MALEDIGIADMTVAAELIGIATWPAARRLLGGDIPALDVALARACGAVKDRTGDHLASIVGREPIPNMDRVALKTASPNALLAMIASSDLPWGRRLRAAVLVSGRSEDDSVRLSAAGLDAVFDVLHELGAPSLLILACEAYAARQRDALPALVPFAAVLHAGSIDRVVTHDLQPAELVGELPAYAFDPVNTRIGKRAVDLWLRSYLSKPQWLPRQVAAALWNAESAACDRTLSWPLGDAIRERAFAADLSFRGLPPDRHGELNDWIAREWPALTCARTAAFASAARASAKPAEASEQAKPSFTCSGEVAAPWLTKGSSPTIASAPTAKDAPALVSTHSAKPSASSLPVELHPSLRNSSRSKAAAKATAQNSATPSMPASARRRPC